MSKMPDTYDEAWQWSMDRVGKVVYRCPLTCKCKHCNDVVDNGLTITDVTHAEYITDCAMEIGFRYADSKEEL